MRESPDSWDGTAARSIENWTATRADAVMDQDERNAWLRSGGWRAADRIRWMIPTCTNTSKSG